VSRHGLLRHRHAQVAVDLEDDLGHGELLLVVGVGLADVLVSRTPRPCTPSPGVFRGVISFTTKVFPRTSMVKASSLPVRRRR
jgi:hypothetical protein